MGLLTHVNQISLLTQKNWKVQFRRRWSLVLRLALPFIFLAAYSSFRNSASSAALSTPPVEPAGGGINPCQDYVGGDNCFTLRYTNGSDPVVQQLMNLTAIYGNLPLETFEPMPDGFDTVDTIGEWVWANPNQTTAILHWMPPVDTAGFFSGWTGVESSFPFALYVNTTRQEDTWQNLATNKESQDANIFGQVSTAIMQAIIHYEAETRGEPIPSGLEPTLDWFPPLSTGTGDNAAKFFDIAFGMFFIAGPLMGQFHGPLMDLVQERANKLHQGLVLMGMKQFSYIASWALFYGVWAAYSTFVVIRFGGDTIPVFWFFIDSELQWYLWGSMAISTVALAILMASLIKGARGAIGTAALFYTVFGFTCLISGTAGWRTFLFESSHDPNRAFGIGTIFTSLLALTPFWQGFQVLTDVYRVTQDPEALRSGEQPVYGWDDIYFQNNITVTDYNSETFDPVTGNYFYDSYWFLMPPAAYNLRILLGMTPVYLALAWLFYHILPGQYGAWANPLNPRFWGINLSTTKANYTFNRRWMKVDEDGDPDVAAMVESTFDPNHAKEQGLVVAGLTKRFGSHTAVDRLSFNAPKTGCLSVLGHNGAGKTTTINLILGIHSISSGNAVVLGQSSVSNVNGVRGVIGICPQHDVLWDELTARETLHMFARLKGLIINTDKEVEKALDAVRLTTVADQYVSSYSGGMKRRLSVALSTIGSPGVIFLDEPTSGLDPLNKRHIWELIQKLKKDCLIVLTTHSMMEADALSDNVAVMAGGRLKAYGPSLRLKEKYGLGYHIDIFCHPENELAVTSMVAQRMPGSRLDASNSGNLNYSVPSAASAALTEFLAYLEADVKSGNSLILDYGVSHTTLEEVFLNITSGSAAAKAQHEARQTAKLMASSSRTNLLAGVDATALRSPPPGGLKAATPPPVPDAPPAYQEKQ